MLVSRIRWQKKKTYGLTDNTFSFPVMDSCDSKIENFVPKSKK